MSVSRRNWILGLGAALAGAGGAFAALYRPFPSDRVPEGAYIRIARSVARDDPKAFFAYLETEAQWACFTIHDMRKKALARVSKSYPEPQRTELTGIYTPLANAADGSDVFAHLYRTRHWDRRLRKDLSGSVQVDIDPKGERATVVTARGTRWPFRKRDNGIWGLTVFTAELIAEAEKATRDLAVVEAAAADYDKLRGH
jgi:cold shock CspA family protein